MGTMKRSLYNEITEQIHASGSRQCLKLIAEKYPQFSKRTLGSIYSQDYQRKVKKSYHRHYNHDRMESYYCRFLHEVRGKKNAHILLEMSEEIDISPSFLARIVLERHLVHTQFDGEQPPKGLVTKLLKDTSQINHAVLAHEIDMALSTVKCILADENYGPYVDTIKHSIGYEYECVLKRRLNEEDISFQDEDNLREKGYDKTPDTKLDVPIAVDGHVVNWIESKASFGDEESHKAYLKDQFWSYWNRFGPGLVIYWFGFIEELDTHREKGIMLMDHFPEEIVKMDPLSLAPVSY